MHHPLDQQHNFPLYYLHAICGYHDDRADTRHHHHNYTKAYGNHPPHGHSPRRITITRRIYCAKSYIKFVYTVNASPQKIRHHQPYLYINPVVSISTARTVHDRRLMRNFLVYSYIHSINNSMQFIYIFGRSHTLYMHRTMRGVTHRQVVNALRQDVCSAKRLGWKKRGRMSIRGSCWQV